MGAARLGGGGCQTQWVLGWVGALLNDACYLHHTSDVTRRDGGSTVTKPCPKGAGLLFGGAKGERWRSCHCTSAERGRTGYVAAAEEEEEEEEV